ncbi:hypothetical protein EBB07_20725 [Paenibacillaceae bacterium]|nr:hypothetical protein EBB07_20725 [Paenibacillaceae bacterium]
MEPSDNDLRRDLARGPLKHGGFNDELKYNILQMADHGGPAKRQNWRAICSWSGAAAVLVLLTVFLINGLPRHPLQGHVKDQFAANHNTSNAGAFTSVLDPDAAFRSALLVGLRTDHEGGGSEPAHSDYRTILVAADEGHLTTMKEGDGILLPFGQDFWMIEPVKGNKQGKEVSILSAYPAADGKPSDPPALLLQEQADAREKTALDFKQLEEAPLPTSDARDEEQKPLLINEKLTFAGNQFVAVEQTVATDATEAEQSVEQQFLWVKQIEMLKGRTSLDFDVQQEAHVSLEDVMLQSVNSESRYTSYHDNWTIIRKPGRWVGQEAVLDILSSNKLNFELKDLLTALPKSVASFDRLSVPWEEIWQRQPEATDAFSSSAEDIVAIVANSKLHFYLNGGGLSESPSLEIELKPNESIVMMQWAGAPLYVERWKTEAKDLLETN